MIGISVQTQMANRSNNPAHHTSITPILHLPTPLPDPTSPLSATGLVCWICRSAGLDDEKGFIEAHHHHPSPRVSAGSQSFTHYQPTPIISLRSYSRPQSCSPPRQYTGVRQLEGNEPRRLEWEFDWCLCLALWAPQLSSFSRTIQSHLPAGQTHPTDEARRNIPVEVSPANVLQRRAKEPNTFSPSGGSPHILLPTAMGKCHR